MKPAWEKIIKCFLKEKSVSKTKQNLDKSFDDIFLLKTKIKKKARLSGFFYV